jgi:coenzyme F420 hydrogenase subunit beta
MLTRLRDSIGQREWSSHDIQKYIGDYHHVYFSYAVDEALRLKASSGGSVTALFVYLLETGQIDGVLAVRTLIQDGLARAQFFIAQNRDELIGAQGSKYSAVYFTTHGLPILKEFDGYLAAVLLPCDAKILHRVRQQEPNLDQKVKLVITLFCGHNSEPELTDIVVRKLNKNYGELTNYTFRYGHWRGKLKAEFEDGTEVERNFETFSDYRNLYLFAQRKCHHCFDHFGYYGDIAAGDIWSAHMKDNPIKHTALITRTDVGQSLVEAAVHDGYLYVEEKDAREVADGQARTMPFHYNVTSRARIGKLFGVRITDEVHEKVRWNDAIIAFLALFNQQVSATKWGKRLIAVIPRQVLRLYLIVFKGLESFSE